MSGNGQDEVVLIACVLAAAYLARRAWRLWSNPLTAGCSSCGGCAGKSGSAPERPELVSIGDLNKPVRKSGHGCGKSLGKPA